MMAQTDMLAARETGAQARKGGTGNWSESHRAATAPEVSTLTADAS
jgi:hypothetical protein